MNAQTDSNTHSNAIHFIMMSLLALKKEIIGLHLKDNKQLGSKKNDQRLAWT
jgi:hypothetical protein